MHVPRRALNACHKTQPEHGAVALSIVGGGPFGFGGGIARFASTHFCLKKLIMFNRGWVAFAVVFAFPELGDRVHGWNGKMDG
jgi:hypothetical protein